MTRYVFFSAAALLATASLLSSCGDTTDNASFSNPDGSAGAAGSNGQGGTGKGATGGTAAGGAGATSGAGGAAGTGGSTGVGGQAGSAGASGNGGQAGSAGTSGNGGQAGTAGASGQGGQAGTGAGGAVGTGGRPDAGSCPATVPAPNSSCSPNGLSCTYGDPCCPTHASCQNGTWLIAVPACIAPSCPSEPPANGSSCDPCRHLPKCDYDRCSSTGMITAACGNQRQWSVTTEACTFACGDMGLRCKQGEVCLVREGAIMVSYQCAADPCAPQAVSCTCANTLCTVPTNRCVAAQTGGNRVTCSCLTCV